MKTEINQFKGARSDYWNTPKDMYNNIMSKGYIDYNPENSMIEPFYKDAQLYQNTKLFINPPFSILNKSEWIETIEQLLHNNNKLLLLVPARTDTRQFHTLLDMGFKVKFIRGRLRYNDEGSAPFPSLYMYSHNIEDNIN